MLSSLAELADGFVHQGSVPYQAVVGTCTKEPAFSCCCLQLALQSGATTWRRSSGAGVCPVLPPGAPLPPGIKLGGMHCRGWRCGGTVGTQGAQPSPHRLPPSSMCLCSCTAACSQPCSTLGLSDGFSIRCELCCMTPATAEPESCPEQ